MVLRSDVVLPAIVPVVLVVGLMLYRGSVESAAYLSVCMALCFALIYVSMMDFSQRSKESEASLPELVAKFHLDVTEMRESLKLLSALKKRVSGSAPKHAQAAREAFDLGLLKYVLAFVQSLEAADSRIPLCCDIINALLSQVPIRSKIHSDEFLLKDTTDSLLQAVKAMSSASTEKVKPVSTLHDIDEDDDDMNKAIEEDFLLPGETQAYQRLEDFSPPLTFLVIFKSPQDTTKPTIFRLRLQIDHGRRLAQYGQLGRPDHHGGPRCHSNCRRCPANLRLFFRRGQMVLRCLVCELVSDSRFLPPSYIPFSLPHPYIPAAHNDTLMQNITFEHPPNKRDFYEKGGLVLAIDALKRHPKNPEVYQQCLALVVSILQIDPHTKMNQSKSRHTALAANIVEALQNGKREFKTHKTIVAMMDQIDQILIMDWS